ncbi:MAG: ATP-binding protein, partial [Gammaproteobacteria bacterium]
MNDAIISNPVTSELDFSENNTLSGYRLKKLEVFNWGTFNDQVWSLNLDGKNCLLTGDIGSGKSTLVDAVTTLLVPANKVDYNKAAGAGKKERHLRSYVLGYYKSERNESTGKSRPVALRDQNSYSVILGVFHNQGYDQTVTLAQVFWMRELQGQPERFFVAAEKALSIKQDFAQFGSEITTLRKRLRKNGCEVMDHFPQYGAWFRRRFGIDNDQALDLFHQTVSMKSVGNLTEFVRGHMLEPFDVAPRIKALIEHFDDLNRAHEAVIKARRQIGKLTPLIVDCDLHQQQSDRVETLRHSREALATYFAEKKRQLLEQRLQRLQLDASRQQNRIEKLTDESEYQQHQQQELKQQIADNGGDRIERLRQEIRQQQSESERRLDKASRYRFLLEPLSMEAVDNADAFIQQQNSLQQKQAQLLQQQADFNNRLRETEFDFLGKKEQRENLKQTISDLRSRQSNIDQIQINIRQQLCQDLSLDESELPFVGELLQVREEDKPWQGAIERLMHNFGLSMLVPDEHYNQVASWVDKTNLRGRLVYFRVLQNTPVALPSPHPDSLLRKIAIKHDSAFYPWLEQEISRRFDVACCETQQQFRREKRAITRNGQIKSSGGRHEKDDRFSLNDRSRFVLGWSNKEKIAALENEARQL